MAAVAVRPAELGIEVRGVRVTEGERVALVVVVGAVEGQRVVGLEGQRPVPDRTPAADPEGQRLVARAGAALGDRERVDAAARGVGADPERGAEGGVVPVHEPEELVGPGVDEVGARRHAPSQVPVQPDAEGPGAGQLEVAGRDLDVRKERRRGRGVELPVDLGDRTQEGVGAAAEEDLLEGAVRGAVRGEDQHGDPGHVGAGRRARHRAAVAPEVPGHPEPRLQVVEVVGNPPVGRERRVAEVGREEGVLRFDEDIGMPRPVPAEAEIERQALAGMPGVLEEQADLVHGRLLPAELRGRDAGDGRRLEVEEHGAGDRRVRGTGAGSARRAVGTVDVAAAVGGEADEAVHRVEDVAAVRQAHELLLHPGPVVFDPGLEEMGARGVRQVLHDLEPVVEGGIDRQEEGQPDPEPVREVHADVGERPAAEPVERGLAGVRGAGDERAVVPARPVLPRPLDPQLVRELVGQQRAEAPVDRVGVAALDAVHRSAPGVHVEGAVHLLRPGVVVFERRLVPAAQVEIQLGEQRAGVVGAADGPELVLEEPRPAGAQERVQPLEVRGVRDPADGLLRLGGRLLVVGEEEERPVADERAADGGPELVPPEIGLPAPPVRGVLGRDLVPLAEVVGGAGQFVGARPGDHVDEPPGRAAELGGGALVHDHQLADRVLVEGERRPLAAALLAEERVVEVGPVHDEVVEDAALAVDVQLVAVGSLGDGRAGRQQRQVHEVAAVARHRVHDFLPQALGAGEVGGLDRGGQLAEDGDRLRGHQLEIEMEVQHLPHPQDRALDAFGAEPAGRGDGQVVGSGRQQAADEAAGTRGLDGGHQVGVPVLDEDDGAGNRGPQRIAHLAPDDAGGGAGLGGEVRGVEEGERQRQEPGSPRTERPRLLLLRGCETHGGILGRTR